MRLYRFDRKAGRAVHQFGSVGLTITPIAHLAGGGQVAAMWIEPGGQVGAHETVGPQLFLVIQGSGWVEDASGARLAITLIHELRRNNLRYGAAALCIGGGQGIAAIFEALG